MNPLTVPIQRLPPQDLDAEQAVLAAALLDSSAIYKAIEVLNYHDFYKPAHQKIFLTLLALHDANEAIDIITLSDALKARGYLDAVGGVSYLSDLMNAVPTAANIRTHAKIVHKKALLRELITVSTDIVTKSYEEQIDADNLLDDAEQSIFSIADRQTKAPFVPMNILVKTGFEIIERLADKRMTGLPTGFEKLDEITSGLQNSDLIIVAGRPSMGKTAFALGLAQNVALKQGGTVGIFSLEMSKEQLVLRMLCSEARVDANKIRSGFLGRPGNDNWRRLIEAASRLTLTPIFIDDSASLSVMEVRGKARRLKAEHGLSLIVVDYLQLMRGRSDANNREQEISDISRSLKALAKELDLPVVALSQLSRAVESREKRRPMLADLRESGAIEQDADVVCFIYRQEVYEPCKCPSDEGCFCGRRGVAEIIIGKQRNGPTGTVNLCYISKFTRFENLDKDHADAKLQP